MREGLDFYYDGKYSVDMGLINVSVGSSGMLEEPFLSSGEIQEMITANSDKPYFYRIKRLPLTFSLTFAFKEKYNEDKIREVARWLCQDYYKPFYTTDNPNRWWYCMPVDDFILVHNSLKEGYVNLTMRCDSRYTYSQIYTLPIIDLTNNVPTGYLMEFDSIGDAPLEPELWIHMKEDGDFRIQNTLTNEIFEFTDLYNDEVVYVNNEKHYIESNISSIYRYDNFNDNYLSFPRGKHQLKIFGKCKLQWRYQFKMLQG